MFVKAVSYISDMQSLNRSAKLIRYRPLKMKNRHSLIHEKWYGKVSQKLKRNG